MRLEDMLAEWEQAGCSFAVKEVATVGTGLARRIAEGLHRVFHAVAFGLDNRLGPLIG